MQPISQLASRRTGCFWLILAMSLLVNLSTALALRPTVKLKQLEADELEYYEAAGEIARAPANSTRGG